LNFITTYAVMNRMTFGMPLAKFFSLFLPQIMNTILVALIAYPMMEEIQFRNVFFELLYKVVLVTVPTVLIALLLRQYNIFKIISRHLK
ncbi:hypothetical protein, partial [uncultured Duncaniella sp.]